MELPDLPNYKIERPLGTGGMATVYLATDIKFDRKVAVKIMARHLQADPDYGIRFKREARLVAGLNHQHIIPVYDVGQHAGQYYLVMEYLPAGDLKHRLQSGIPLGESIYIVKSIATALHYAASKNCIHRDIKPENILFREDGCPVVSDFGIARTADYDAQTALTQTGMIIGTPAYMSPEQSVGNKVDGRSDLYSLGIMFYEMLTGSTPFKGDSPVSVAMKHITEAVPRLPERCSQFQGFIDTALAKKREDRFQTGNELYDALEQIVQYLDDSTESTVLLVDSPGRLSSRRSLRHRDVSSRSLPTGDTSSLHQKAKRARYSYPDGRAEARNRTLKKVAVSIIVFCTISVLALVVWIQYSSKGSLDTISELDISSAELDAQPLLKQAVEAMAEQQYFEPAEANAEYYLVTLLALNPESPGGRNAVTVLFGYYLDLVKEALSREDLKAAESMLNRSSNLSFYIRHDDMLEQLRDLRVQFIDLREELARKKVTRRQVAQLLAEASGHIEAERWSSPPGNNAYEAYQKVLQLDANNVKARQGIEKIAGLFLVKASEAVDQGHFTVANGYIGAAAEIYPQHADLGQVLEQLTKAKQAARAVSLEEARKGLMLKKVEAERQAAEEAKARSEQTRQLIDRLLVDIERDFSEGRLTSPVDNNVVEKIRRIQKLDPANSAALANMEKLVSRLAEFAMLKIGRSELDVAEHYLTEAQQLSPGDARLIAVQAELFEAQSAREREIARQEIIRRLLADADADADAGRRIEAIQKLRNVLELEPDNPTATNAMAIELGVLYEQIERQIDNGRFTDAGEGINELTRLSADPDQVVKLASTLERAEQAEAVRQQQEAEEEEAARIAASPLAEEAASKLEGAAAVGGTADIIRGGDKSSGSVRLPEPPLPKPPSEEDLLAQQAHGLSEQRRTATINSELRDVYLRILSIDAVHDNAKKGLAHTSEFEKSLAMASIEQRDFTAAREHIAVIEKSTPTFGGLSELKRRLRDREQAYQEASTRLSEADRKIATPFEYSRSRSKNKAVRERLLSAYQDIGEARQLDERHPQIETTLAGLELVYADIISEFLARKKLKFAEEFLGDCLPIQWPGGGERIAEVQHHFETLKVDQQSSRPPVSVGTY